MKKEKALSRLNNSRRALRKAIDVLTIDEISTIQVEGIWTVKDVLGHIAAWENSLLEPLSAFVDGGPFQAEEIPDHDAWNAKQAARCSQRSVSIILEEMDTTRQELLNTAEKLSTSQWHQSFRAPWGDQNSLIEMISGLAWHEEEHTKSILNKFTNKPYGK
jgi:hypothetical protein